MLVRRVVGAIPSSSSSRELLVPMRLMGNLEIEDLESQKLMDFHSSWLLPVTPKNYSGATFAQDQSDKAVQLTCVLRVNQ